MKETEFVNVNLFMDANGGSHSISILLTRYKNEQKKKMLYTSYLLFSEVAENTTNKCSIQINSTEFTFLLEQLKSLSKTKKGKGKMFKLSEKKQVTIRTKYDEETDVYSIYISKISITSMGRKDSKYILMINETMLDVIISQIELSIIAVDNKINNAGVEDTLNAIRRDIELLLIYNKKH